ncbi:MAG TPA: hypothetical protein VII56_06445 [Rhizomicrobium sp.]
MRNSLAVTAPRHFAFLFCLALPLGTLAAAHAVGAEIETVVVTGQRQPSDLCLIVAGAKVAQWSQQRVMIREARTFADGSKKDSETIFTVNAAYAHWLGRAWNTVQFLVPQRSISSPDVAARNMKLADCRLQGPAQEGGQSASIYTYSYLPDSDDSHTSGQIWISDSTGLPLRQELSLQEPQPDPKVAVNISAHYSYGDDVHVPSGAELAEDVRRFRVQQWVRDLQAGRSGGP